MNFSHYLNMAKEKKRKKFIFLQNNKPYVIFNRNQVEILSEVALFSEDLQMIEKELRSLTPESGTSSQGNFYLDGENFSFKVLNLQDSCGIEVEQNTTEELSWDDFMVPGYLGDWLEARSGLLFFYGLDKKTLDLFRVEFLKKRSTLTTGQSLVFKPSSSPNSSDSLGEHHFIMESRNEEDFLKSEAALHFDFYCFEQEFTNQDLEKILRLTDQKSLISLNSYWGDIKLTWASLKKELMSRPELTEFFLKSILGFVGVKTATTLEGGKTLVFEVLPFSDQMKELVQVEEPNNFISDFLKKEGVSFNQSLQSLVLKRKISLDEAYDLSQDPEELNKLLSAAGV